LKQNNLRSALQGAKNAVQNIDLVDLFQSVEMPGIAPPAKTSRDLRFLRADDRRAADTADRGGMRIKPSVSSVRRWTLTLIGAQFQLDLTTNPLLVAEAAAAQR
jgi:hypothetical protein